MPLGVKAEAPEGFRFQTAGDVDPNPNPTPTLPLPLPLALPLPLVQAGDVDLVFTPVTVERMRPKDAALLLLELCERELTPEARSQQH